MKLLDAINKGGKTKLYHASPKRFKVGKMLVPGDQLGKKSSSMGWGTHGVFMTNSPVPHFTIMNISYADGWHIYEVRPEGKVEYGMWDDVVAPRAEVVKYIGGARGILNSHFKNKDQLKMMMWLSNFYRKEKRFPTYEDLEPLEMVDKVYETMRGLGSHIHPVLWSKISKGLKKI